MTFYRVFWHEDDSPDGTAQETFASKARAFRAMHARAKADAETSANCESDRYTLSKVTVKPGSFKQTVLALLNDHGYTEDEMATVAYERRCRKCGHAANHDDGCPECHYGDRPDNYCTEPDFVVRVVQP